MTWCNALNTNTNKHLTTIFSTTFYNFSSFQIYLSQMYVSKVDWTKSIRTVSKHICIVSTKSVIIRVRTIPPMPLIPILPILILNRYRFQYRYRYRKWCTQYRTGRHWKAEYAICKWLFRPILVLSMLLFFPATSISSLAAVSGGGHILTCWAGPWETRRRAGGVTEQACQVIQKHPLVNRCL